MTALCQEGLVGHLSIIVVTPKPEGVALSGLRPTVFRTWD
jgi:hypothetical protein